MVFSPGKIPKEVRAVVHFLEHAGFEAYLVGGCVRDLLLSRQPKDWDVTTNALPEEVQKVFPDHVYENQFGTVGVKTGSDDPRLKIIEVTTYRIEGKYTDKRHPDEIKFAKNVEEDLSRRDFTINAIALSLDDGELKEIVDPYGGEEDLQGKIIRTVGNPIERFHEDALRLMRAARFAVELGFDIDPDTARAIEQNSFLLDRIAKERVRDELVKIIMAPEAAQGIRLLEEMNLLQYVIPELREGLGVGQNKHHIYTVFEHNVRALEYTAKQGYSFDIRMASLLHDVGKPRSKQGEGPDSTFYQHEYIGAKMTLKIMDRLRFSREVTEKVAHLVRAHLFYYNVGEVTETGVRRFLRRVGPQNVDDLLKVREADRIGSGVPKAFPYKLRHLQFMIEKVKSDPISPKMLKVDGKDIMEIADIVPGPIVGRILSILLEEVLDDPAKNDREYLEKRIKELAALSDVELEKLASKAKEVKEEYESGMEKEMKGKFGVK
jgi:poly(A) polymerase/tRNA nucleotidyltransferase (CCA-adding enzyme)